MHELARRSVCLQLTAMRAGVSGVVCVLTGVSAWRCLKLRRAILLFSQRFTVDLYRSFLLENLNFLIVNLPRCMI